MHCHRARFILLHMKSTAFKSPSVANFNINRRRFLQTVSATVALSALGVHAGQGWHLGRPTAAADFVQAVRALTRAG